MQQASLKRKLQLVELEEIYNDVYKNVKVYKQQMKAFDKQNMRKYFTLDQKVLLFNSYRL